MFSKIERGVRRAMRRAGCVFHINHHFCLHYSTITDFPQYIIVNICILFDCSGKRTREQSKSFPIYLSVQITANEKFSLLPFLPYIDIPHYRKSDMDQYME